MKTSSPLRRSLRARSGFTLIEIILVLSIISILMGAVIFNIVTNLDDAREIRAKADIQAYTTAIKRYEMLSLYAPTTQQGLQALVTRPTTAPVPGSWKATMQSLTPDPWGNPYQYANPGKHNANGLDIYSLGPDKKESDDDIGNWQK